MRITSKSEPKLYLSFVHKPFSNRRHSQTLRSTQGRYFLSVGVRDSPMVGRATRTRQGGQAGMVEDSGATSAQLAGIESVVAASAAAEQHVDRSSTAFGHAIAYTPPPSPDADQTGLAHTHDDADDAHLVAADSDSLQPPTSPSLAATVDVLHQDEPVHHDELCQPPPAHDERDPFDPGTMHVLPATD